jgi:hypothetical protein
MDNAERIAALHVELVTEQDDHRRARLHLELAGLCVAAGHLEHAARHFREALLFEPSLQAARTGLEGLAARARPERPPRARMRDLLGRVRARVK